MITIDSISLDRFNGQIALLQEALVGAGGDGDLHTIVKNVGADLAMTISDSLGPKSKKSGESYIRGDVRTVFSDGPNQIFPVKQRGKGSMVWLFAKSDILSGVEKENFMPGLSESGMSKTLRDRQVSRVGVSAETTRKGAMQKRTLIGSRGKQKVYRINRILVQRGRTESLAKAIASKRSGRLRATFAYAAHMLGRTRISPWIRDKFSSVAADGAAIFDQSKLNDKAAPMLSFGGSAPGLIENFEGLVLEAIDKAADRLYQVSSAIIHGYAKDYESGRKISAKANWMKSKQ